MQLYKNKNIIFEEGDYLWRYLDIYKFLSFIINKKLHFTRLDNFQDPLEGITLKLLSYQNINDMTPDSDEKINQAIPAEMRASILESRRLREDYINVETPKLQKTQFANCWYVGKKESIAMWNLYSYTESIAIRYKPEELIKLVTASAESYRDNDFKTFIYGFVDYIDIWPYSSYNKIQVDIFYNAFKKDDSYDHEKEFRFVTAISTECIDRYDHFELPIGDITFDDFSIFTNPYLDEWKINTIRDLLTKYSLDSKIMKSRLKIKK